MRLRPRQQQAVDASCEALDKHKDTLLVAPTGAGKTIMLSAVTGKRIIEAPKDTPNKALILQHRDELVEQNAKKFRRVNPHTSITTFDSAHKSWAGRAVFAMVQTLSRGKHLQSMPPFRTITIDEAHHAITDSYGEVIIRAREANPDVEIFGVTATANRGDGSPLRKVFSNVADQITLGELIASGHLVRPRTFVLDVGVTSELQNVRRLSTDFDMKQVAEIMDREIITDQIVEVWANGWAHPSDPSKNVPPCRDRPTIVFCSNKAHAEHVTDTFDKAGYRVAVIHDGLTKAQRRDTIADFKRGVIQVLVNVGVLTEGFDHPPTSCVILLRPSSYKSTMMQMVGRGLRTIDPDEHPGIVKLDCIVLDFGTSSITHGSLEDDANLDGRLSSGEAPKKECPGCEAEVPISTMECPLCGYQWERQAREKSLLGNIVLTEIDLLVKSNFKWVDIWGDSKALMAAGFDTWAGLFFWEGIWHAVGGTKDEMRHLGVGDRLVALAMGDDYLNDKEDSKDAFKTKRWLREPASPKQLQALQRPPYDTSLSKYEAMCMLGFRKNKRAIQSIVMRAKGES